MEPGTPAIAVYEFYATLLKASSDPSPFVSILIEAWKNKDGRFKLPQCCHLPIYFDLSRLLGPSMKSLALSSHWLGSKRPCDLSMRLAYASASAFSGKR